MTHTDSSANDILAKLAQMQATLEAQQATIDRQQATIAQQQSAIVALQQAQQSAVSAAAPCEAATPAAGDLRGMAKPTRGRKSGKLGRRGLLLGAAGVAGATVATAAVASSPRPAFAAPDATGDTFLLGQSNDAGTPTILANTTGTTGDVLHVTATELGAANFSAVTGTTYIKTTSGFTAPFYPNGVLGQSDSGIGVTGVSWDFIDLAAEGSGRIYQWMQTYSGPPIGTGYLAGESIRDVDGDLWLCTGHDTSGNPIWAKVALLAPGATVGGAITYLTKPIRLLDTRLGATDANQLPNAPVSSSSPFTVYVANVNYNGVQVPSTAIGAIGNVTVVAGPSSSGYLEVVPQGAGFTGAANLAFGPNQVVSNAFNVGLNGVRFRSIGTLDVVIGGSSVDVIVDLFAVVTGVGPALGG